MAAPNMIVGFDYDADHVLRAPSLRFAVKPDPYGAGTSRKDTEDGRRLITAVDAALARRADGGSDVEDLEINFVYATPTTSTSPATRCPAGGICSGTATPPTSRRNTSPRGCASAGAAAPGASRSPPPCRRGTLRRGRRRSIQLRGSYPPSCQPRREPTR